MKKFLIAVFFMISTSQISFAAKICQEDLDQLCPGLSGEAAQTCLRQNFKKWSEPCKAEIKDKMNMAMAKNPEAKARIEKAKASYQETKALAAACLEKMKTLRKKQQAENAAIPECAALKKK